MKNVAIQVDAVFGAVLSFNKNEEDTDTVFTALEVVDAKIYFHLRLIHLAIIFVLI